MEKKGHSRRGFFGETIHHDADGNKIGESRRNFLGGYSHFDADGNKVGSTHRNSMGGVNHYNADGEKTGSSYRGFCGQTNHFDNDGNKVGESVRNFTEGQNHYSTKDHPADYSNTNGSNVPQNGPKMNNPTKIRRANAFTELLILTAFAGFILFVLGLLLRWEDTLFYLLLCIVSFVWFVHRVK